jgi:glucose/arabinose dehydrogenase
MRKISYYLCLLFVLSACQENEATVPPTIAMVATEALVESLPTAVPPNPPPALATDEPTTIPTLASTPNDTPATEVPPTAVPAASVSSITLEPIVNGGLIRPIYLTHAGDERLFVVEQPGLIRIIEEGELLEEPFLDIQDRVNDGANEQGLLSVAFHPDYGENDYFYVNYTNDSGDTVIGRFQVSTDEYTADANSETILLTIPQPYRNHNGGQLQFGPDGNLYIGMGDGGSADDPQGNGQNANTLLGSLLRIDVNQDPYAIPASNPYGNEIWAIGLRNPWRFSFDRLTGDLYIADVGQNTYEEVDFQPASSPGGENYGWSTMEGQHCFSPRLCNQTGLEQPIFEYDHALGCSVTGGYVYRGQQFLTLYGNYFVADYCTGIIWSLFPEADGTWTSQQVFSSGLIISSFGEDINGELYVIDHSGGIWGIRP